MQHIIPESEKVGSLSDLNAEELDRESTRCMREIDRQIEEREAYRAANKQRQFTAEFRAIVEKYQKCISELFEGMVAVQVVLSERELAAFAKQGAGL